MGWSFEIEKEAKEYEVKGTVSIGTDEYRDLITENCELKRKAQKEHDDWYREYNRANDLEKRLKACEEKLSEVNAWFDSDDSLRPKFRLWKMEQIEKEESEEE